MLVLHTKYAHGLMISNFYIYFSYQNLVNDSVRIVNLIILKNQTCFFCHLKQSGVPKFFYCLSKLIFYI